MPLGSTRSNPESSFSERGKPIYITALGSGAILVDNGNIKLIGNVKMHGYVKKIEPVESFLTHASFMRILSLTVVPINRTLYKLLFIAANAFFISMRRKIYLTVLPQQRQSHLPYESSLNH